MLSLISCANSPSNDITKSDSIKRAKSDSVQTAENDSIKFHSADSLRIAKYRIINEKSPALIQFKYLYTPWGKGEARRAVWGPLIITYQHRNDSILTIKISGVHTHAEYHGNIKIDGKDLILYYWVEDPAFSLAKYDLTYKIRIGDHKDYHIKIESLGIKDSN
jgi:hypothetical protein